ncbi:MAG: hypothetical protein MJ250_01870 [Alphaproteobacteria bacterium]|nr:hypothetical protein [Alphaproteobacteria bacterium]
MTENQQTLDKKNTSKSENDLEGSSSQIVELSEDQMKDIIGGTNNGYIIYNDKGAPVNIGSLPLS